MYHRDVEGQVCQKADQKQHLSLPYCALHCTISCTCTIHTHTTRSAVCYRWYMYTQICYRGCGYLSVWKWNRLVPGQSRQAHSDHSHWGYLHFAAPAPSCSHSDQVVMRQTVLQSAALVPRSALDCIAHADEDFAARRPEALAALPAAWKKYSK